MRRAHLQEAVLAAEKLVLLHDGLGAQEQLVLTESRLAPAREDCLSIKRKQCDLEAGRGQYSVKEFIRDKLCYGSVPMALAERILPSGPLTQPCSAGSAPGGLSEEGGREGSLLEQVTPRPMAGGEAQRRTCVTSDPSSSQWPPPGLLALPSSPESGNGA